MRNDVEIAIVAEGVLLHASDGSLLKAGGKWVFTEQELVGAVHILDASPYGIAGAEAHRGLEKIAVKDGVVLNRSSSAPQYRARPVTLVKAPVIHYRCG